MVVFCCSTVASQLSAGGKDDGALPVGRLTLSGSTLFGATSHGGAARVGTIYSMNTDGTEYELLHEFAPTPDLAARPLAGLALSGSTLLGTTMYGGEGIAQSTTKGTIFSMNTDGTDFRLLHVFPSELIPLPGGTYEILHPDGIYPDSELTLQGTKLFGTTPISGRNNWGTLYSMNTDGSDFTVLVAFDRDDGSIPSEALTLDGSTLFGTTRFGGREFGFRGTIYSVNTDGTGYTRLHEFALAYPNGPDPNALTLIGSTLFGTTSGGDRHPGTIFKMNTDGTGFELQHEFAGGADDGSKPYAGMINNGSTLFGTTGSGGDHDAGTIFSINTDGTGFTLLHEFAGGPDDGARPESILTISGSTLFGTTYYGGDHNFGTVFSIETDGTGFTLLHEFAGTFVPEPSALVLMHAGVGGLLIVSRCQTRQSTTTDTEPSTKALTTICTTEARS
jgi:uncharacterized repeat protein (TIGR03803 family)